MNKVISVALLSLVFVGNVSAGPEDSYDRTMDSKKIAWMDAGKKAVQSKLKDGDSAKFRNVYFHRGTENIPMTCGEVNAKNSFGGYGGFQKFMSAGKPELTFLQEQVEDFSSVWKSFCQ